MTQLTGIKADLSARILRTSAEIRQIASGWRELFHRCRATAFQSPDWLLPWIEVFSPEKMRFIEMRRDDQLVAVAPLLIYRRGSEQVLAFMGGGVSDYLDVLIDPTLAPEDLSRILHALCNAQEDWTVLDLTDIPSHSPLLSLPFLRGQAGEHDCCSILHLPGTSEELLHLFSKRQRANLRNARSRLDRAGGGQVEIATAESIPEFLDELFALHTNRWSQQGRSGVLGDARVREFHSSCTPCLLQDGLLHLSRLRLRDRTLAVIYSLFAGQRAFCYLQGFDPEYSSFSPGTQLMFSVISDAAGQGMVEFDFLRGRETYKQHWRAERKPTYRIQIPRMALASITETNNPVGTIAA